MVHEKWSLIDQNLKWVFF